MRCVRSKMLNFVEYLTSDTPSLIIKDADSFTFFLSLWSSSLTLSLSSSWWT